MLRVVCGPAGCRLGCIHPLRLQRFFVRVGTVIGQLLTWILLVPLFFLFFALAFLRFLFHGGRLHRCFEDEPRQGVGGPLDLLLEKLMDLAEHQFHGRVTRNMTSCLYQLR